MITVAYAEVDRLPLVERALRVAQGATDTNANS